MNLSQVTTINSGYPFRGKIPEKPGTAIVAVQLKHTSPQSGINWAACTEVQLNGKRKPGWLQTGDILFAARGSHNYAVCINDELNRLNIKAVAAPHYFVLRIKPIDHLKDQQPVLPEYLSWLLNQVPCQRYFGQNAEGSFTKSIRRSVLEKTPIAIPPMVEQKSIVALAAALKKEQETLQHLVLNNEKLLNSIANGLINKEVSL